VEVLVDAVGVQISLLCATPMLCSKRQEAIHMVPYSTELLLFLVFYMVKGVGRDLDAISALKCLLKAKQLC